MFYPLEPEAVGLLRHLNDVLEMLSANFLPAMNGSGKSDLLPIHSFGTYFSNALDEAQLGIFPKRYDPRY